MFIGVIDPAESEYGHKNRLRPQKFKGVVVKILEAVSIFNGFELSVVDYP